MLTRFLKDVTVRGDPVTKCTLRGDGTFPLMIAGKGVELTLEDIVFENGYHE